MSKQLSYLFFPVPPKRPRRPRPHAHAHLKKSRGLAETPSPGDITSQRPPSPLAEGPLAGLAKVPSLLRRRPAWASGGIRRHQAQGSLAPLIAEFSAPPRHVRRSDNGLAPRVRLVVEVGDSLGKRGAQPYIISRQSPRSGPAAEEVERTLDRGRDPRRRASRELHQLLELLSRPADAMRRTSGLRMIWTKKSPGTEALPPE